MSAPDPLPRPMVTSTGSFDFKNGVYRIEVTASRDGRSRSWIGAGPTPQDAGRELVEKVLEDHHTAEYVKRG